MNEDELVASILDELEDTETEIREIISCMENRGENPTSLWRVWDMVRDLIEKSEMLSYLY